MFATVPVPAWPGLLHRWLQHPGTTALLWLIAGILAIWLLHTAWHTFDNPPNTPPERCRIDGNCGHTHIDFGAQWLMGRMIATGRGQHLYHRQWLWLTAQEGFSYEQEPPLIRQQVVLPVSQRYGLQPEDDVRHDAEKLMGWLMGEDAPGWGQLGGLVGAVLAPVTPAPLPLWHPPVLQAIQTMATPAWLAQLEQPAIGGPLYPPVQAVWYAPLGLLPPQRAYRLFQVLALVLVFVAAWAVSRLTGQRIPWPLAAIGLLLYPGTRAALDLAQNPTLTLTLLVLGWLAFSRGREILAGCLWGCLAFKPVWAAAFLLVPLLMGRWKFLLAMCMTGVTWIVITLPFVGLHSWWEWLEVGRLANALYCVDDNWIHLSRDLHGIPRRFLHDFSQPADHRDTLLAQALAWTLWGGVLLVTVVVYRLRVQQRRSSGIGAAFLLLGAWLCCYRFMYYDVLLTALAWAALLAEHWAWLPQRCYTLVPLDAPDRSSTTGPELIWGYLNSFPLTILALIYVIENMVMGLNLQATVAIGHAAVATTQADGSTALHSPQLSLATGIRYPWDTTLILLLWLWCGIQLLRGKEATPLSS